MAGKRQHYVPRFLQRGFLHDKQGEAERTWLHRRGVDARLVSIRAVGVQDWFYSYKSLDGSPTLDDAITEFEDNLGSSVKMLRECVPGSSVDAKDAANTVIHLVMRTAHVRQIFAAGIAGIVSEIDSLFTDPTRLRGLVGVTGSSPSAVVLDAIRDSARDLEQAQGVPPALSERLIAFQLRELGEQFIEELISISGTIFSPLLGQLSKRVRDAHNSVLATTAEESVWVSTFSSFVWTVEEGENLILPDAIALVREDDGRLVPLLFTKASDANAVIMPVSRERMLVGRAVGGAPIDISDFNAQAAACCETFFISAEPLDPSSLRKLIGSAVAGAIEETISEAIREAEQSRTTTETSALPVVSPEFADQNFSFSVRLEDFGDESRAKEIGQLLEGVVGALSRIVPLQHLDGFTFAVDYPAAVEAIDRGDADLPPVTSHATSYSHGVAIPVPVMRDNVRKEHLVISAGLAELWRSADVRERDSGLHMLVRVLFGVAHSFLYSKARDTPVPQDAMTLALHHLVDTAPIGYWCARQSAFVDPDQGQKLADLVVESLSFADEQIASEKARVTESTDISIVTIRTSECVSMVLSHAANWLGHRDGLAESEQFLGGDLAVHLKARGLDRWIELFGRDLAGCYDSNDALNLLVASKLSSHVERLFWAFGVICWPEDEVINCRLSEHPFPPVQPN